MSNQIATDNAQLIVVLGVRASGKSTAAKQLVKSHGYVVVPKLPRAKITYPELVERKAVITLDRLLTWLQRNRPNLIVIDELDSMFPLNFLDDIEYALHKGCRVVVFHTPSYTHDYGYESDQGMSEKLISLVYQTPYSSSLHLWTKSFRDHLNQEQHYDAWFTGE